MDQCALSIVIPVYNSSGCLPELLKQLAPVLERLDPGHEVILVDDDSRDGSWNVIRDLAEHHPRLRGFRLMRNAGQARATLCGLAHARGGIVVTMDDDLQHRPDQVPVLVEALRADPELDCVMGFFPEKRHAGYRNLGSRLIRRINNRVFGLPPDVAPSSFRAMRGAVARAIVEHRTASAAIAALLFDSTARVKSLPVPHAERFAGRSGYSLARQFRLAFDNICTVHMLPLRIISAMGFTVCILSLIFAASVLYRYLANRIAVPGWTTLAILTSFSSGVILLSLGVIGEYMIRILREVRGFPRFLVRDRIGIADPPPGDPAP